MRRSGWILNSTVVACLTLAMSLLATVGAWYLAKSLADEDAQHRFEQRAIEITNAIAGRMLDYEQVLRGAVGLFAASQLVGRAEWRAYVEPIKLEQSYPGFQGIGFAKWVPGPEKDAHVDRIRAEGFFDYAVSPPGERAEYVPAVYLEPFSERNLWAFGYDMFSEPTRRAAIERARDTGSATISGKVTLEQETAHDLQAGFLMYLPVYRNGARTGSVEQRRSALIGYVYSPFRVNDLMRGILRGQTKDVAIDIFDGAVDSESARMYGSHGSRLPMFMRETTVAVAGEVWTLRVSSLPAFEAAVEEDTPEIVFTSGLFVSALLLTLTLTLVNRRAAATQMAKEMTLSLRESEAKFRSVAESAHEAIIIIDADGKVVSWNRGAEHIFGYEVEEIVGRELLLLMPVRFREQHREGLARVRTSGEARVIGKTVEFAGLNKDGREFPLELSLAAWETGSGRFYSGIVRDISKRKAAERKADELTASLRAKEGELRAVVENVADGIIAIDEAGVMLEANRAACEIFRFSPSEILGKKLHELIPEVRTHKPEKVEHRRREMVGRRGDGSEFPLELSYGGEQIDVGGKVLYTGAVRDISERKAAERMKSEFIATVSHELRTPLTAIIGSLGLVRSEMLEELPGPAKKFVIMAHQNSERLAALINDILDIEKIEGGYIAFRLEPVELRDCLRQSTEMCGGYADQFGVQFELREPLPRVKLRADRDRLAQVLANLLSNAAKFSPRGGRVQIAATANDGTAKVAVSDRGPGVPEEFVGRLFGKFAQADSSTTRVKGGTGLGLSISRMLVEKMGGTIGYERKAEVGATFYFELPLWQERAPVVGEPGGPQILLCEDERDTATLIGDMLAREGYTVHIAYSAALARELLASHKCAGMILDLSLPDEDGVQLVKSMRAASVKLPIIIASERANAHRAQLRDEDIADWLDKPFTREQLVEAVRRALARSSRDKEWAHVGPIV